MVISRWHEQDLAGELLAEPDGMWTHINVPAIASAGVADALGREPGVAMVSALGRTAESFHEIKRAVGSARRGNSTPNSRSQISTCRAEPSSSKRRNTVTIASRTASSGVITTRSSSS